MNYNVVINSSSLFSRGLLKSILFEIVSFVWVILPLKKSGLRKKQKRCSIKGFQTVPGSTIVRYICRMWHGVQWECYPENDPMSEGLCQGWRNAGGASKLQNLGNVANFMLILLEETVKTIKISITLATFNQWKHLISSVSSFGHRNRPSDTPQKLLPVFLQSSLRPCWMQQRIPWSRSQPVDPGRL